MDHMKVFVVLVVAVPWLVAAITQWPSQEDVQEPPDGYYAFVESPNSDPPKVRRPPYMQSDKECPNVHGNQKSLNNLCGDLNKGYIPRNPMGQSVLGSSYPFELVKNKTLTFFSKTLPILKADETLPKVAKYQQDSPSEDQLSHNRIAASYHPRSKREANTSSERPTTDSSERPRFVSESALHREARKLCDNGGGVLCLLYKAFSGEPLAGGLMERRDEVGGGGGTDVPEFRRGEPSPGPPTACPAKVEYATPVFARNYQGVWRYVVQIPYEGYFTQTVEVTRCLQSRCHYMEGGCMSSPRWVSLLVAEIYYPDTFLPPSGTRYPQRNPVAADSPPPVHDFQNYQQYLHKRAGVTYQQSTETPQSGTPKPATHCDGVDEIGCFQVRLYYDWFLIPGSCKCWRPDYFSRYVRRKVNSDL